MRFNRFKDQNTHQYSLYLYISVSSCVGAPFNNGCCNVFRQFVHNIASEKINWKHVSYGAYCRILSTHYQNTGQSKVSVDVSTSTKSTNVNVEVSVLKLTGLRTYNRLCYNNDGMTSVTRGHQQWMTLTLASLSSRDSCSSVSWRTSLTSTLTS